MEKKKTTKRKTTTARRSRSTSKNPSVNVKVKTKSVWSKILPAIIILLLVLPFLLFVQPLNLVGHLFKNWFGAEEQYINVDAFDGVNVNTNGGLTKEQIKQETAENDCPVHSDMSDNLYLLDYNDFVCFYKKLVDSNGDYYYPNIVFVKTNEGLKYNGALNTTGHVIYSGWVGALQRDVSIKQDMSVEPSYGYRGAFLEWMGFDATGLCLFDSTSTAFYNYEIRGLIAISAHIDLTSSECTQSVLNQARDYLAANVVNPYFLKFCNNKVEIIQNAENPYADFNAFYDFIYRTAATQGLSKCVVDVTDLTCYPLPADKKTSYPKTTGGYYSVYKCNTMLTCFYKKINESSIYAGNKSVADGLKDDEISTISVEVNPLYSSTINIAPKSWTKLIGSAQKIQEAFLESPVKIDFYNSQNELCRSILFDSDNYNLLTLSATINTGFSKGTYTYTISSNKILFDSYNGAINVTGNSTINIKYDYNDGLVSTSFKIAPASNVDYSDVDFSATPTKIQLTSTDNKYNYIFTFDSSDKVNEYITQNVMQGEYTVVILSDALEFATDSATITINDMHKNFEYQFAVKGGDVVIEKTLKINSTTNTLQNSLNATRFAYHFSSETLSAMAEYLELDENSNLNVSISLKQNGSVVKTDTFNLTADQVVNSNVTRFVDIQSYTSTSSVIVFSADDTSYTLNVPAMTCPEAYDRYIYINAIYD